MRWTIRLGGTAVVTVLLTYPLWAPGLGSGILGEVWALGWPGGLIGILGFFGLVALYCRQLQRLLTLVRPQARPVSPRSVWWMFAIPFNFVEDFFIVGNISAGLSADGRLPQRIAQRWTRVGYCWCGFQILSLCPGRPGYLGGAVAVVLWLTHWVQTTRAASMLEVRPTDALATV
ncbi:hypothetical protein [Nocardia sp. NPDC057455]|uniref:hypothetical protein n=1 Tax=Nocardia sp. NPDC057455 TaxID=3346138 RepID=UPI00366DD012